MTSRNCSKYKPLKCKLINSINWVARTDIDHLIEEHHRQSDSIRSICLLGVKRVLERDLLNVVHSGQDLLVIPTYNPDPQHPVLLTASSDRCLLAMRASLSSVPM